MKMALSGTFPHGFEFALFLYHLYSDGGIPVSRIPLLAAVAGSMVTRTTSSIAFQKYGRSVVTQDMLSEIGKAFINTFEDKSSGQHAL